MKATKIEVSGLFGLFNHSIPLSATDRITIVHAPNGYGKTAILRLVNSLSKLRYSVLEETEYEKLSVTFDDGRIWEVSRTLKKASGPTKGSEEPSVQLTFTRYRQRQVEDQWQKPDLSPSEAISPSQIERMIPQLDRIGPRQWRSFETGRSYNFDQVLEEFSERFPEKLRHLYRPQWLVDLSKKFPVHLVETQRLLTLQAETARSYSARSE